MVGRARKEYFDPDEVGIYHCYNRCVRKAFLCGEDPEGGGDFSHRKDWVRQRLEALASVFAIDVVTHSAMDNHLHVVLRNRPDVAMNWTDEMIARRWLRLNAKQLQLREVEEEQVSDALRDPERIAAWRRGLSNISEFMRMLDEPIAREANREDDVRGHFWEERFKCQRLLDEASVLACSLYVDLNPIRAALAETPEASRYTSAFDRIQDWRSVTPAEPPTPETSGLSAATEATSHAQSGWLAPVDEAGDGYDGAAHGRRASDKGILPLTLPKYLEFLDWTGRQVVAGKAGAIPSHLAPILERLGAKADRWIETVTNFGSLFGHVVGRAAAVVSHAAKRGRRFWRGTGSCRMAFG